MPATPTGYLHLHLESSGRAWVDGVNVKVIEIAADFLAHSSSVEEMAIQFPSLTPSMIHSTSAYYYDHARNMRKRSPQPELLRNKEKRHSCRFKKELRERTA